MGGGTCPLLSPAVQWLRFAWKWVWQPDLQSQPDRDAPQKKRFLFPSMPFLPPGCRPGLIWTSLVHAGQEQWHKRRVVPPTPKEVLFLDPGSQAGHGQPQECPKSQACQGTLQHLILLLNCEPLPPSLARISLGSWAAPHPPGSMNGQVESPTPRSSLLSR